MRVAVFGAGGRMGSTVCEAIRSEPDLELVAAVDPGHAGKTISGVVTSADPAALAEAGTEVAVDFTAIDAARQNLRWCADHGVHAVAGTSGFEQADYEELAAAFTTSNCLIAPNFAIGAVLMMRFAAMAAPLFDTAEIIELHHNAKIDAPSGTATRTAELMAAASDRWSPDPTTKLAAEGARGADGPAGIRVHSVRLAGLVAHQEVLLGTTGQTLTIRHDSYDRSSFMPGVLLACRSIKDRPGLTVGLEALLPG